MYEGKVSFMSRMRPTTSSTRLTDGPQLGRQERRVVRTCAVKDSSASTVTRPY